MVSRSDAGTAGRREQRAVSKRYDRAYFERWYRRPASRIDSPAELRRRVALAVAIAERWLARPVRSALDIGCGEARWRAELRRLRPRLRYVGVDPSPYVVERYGRSRDIRQGSFAELSRLAPGGPFDLVICADVLHYVEDADLRAGLPALVELTGGVAYLETLTADEQVEGDRRAIHLRPPAFYVRMFASHGLVGVGSHVWLAPALGDLPSALERR